MKGNLGRNPGNDSEICALCGQAKWVHILPGRLRRERNPLDDGHAFDSTGGQLALPFGGEPSKRKQYGTTVQELFDLRIPKEALQQKAMRKAGQKKPLHRQQREKTAKPSRRSVA